MEKLQRIWDEGERKRERETEMLLQEINWELAQKAEIERIRPLPEFDRSDLAIMQVDSGSVGISGITEGELHSLYKQMLQKRDNTGAYRDKKGAYRDKKGAYSVPAPRGQQTGQAPPIMGTYDASDAATVSYYPSDDESDAATVSYYPSDNESDAATVSYYPSDNESDEETILDHTMLERRGVAPPAVGYNRDGGAEYEKERESITQRRLTWQQLVDMAPDEIEKKRIRDMSTQWDQKISEAPPKSKARLERSAEEERIEVERQIRARRRAMRERVAELRSQLFEPLPPHPDPDPQAMMSGPAPQGAVPAPTGSNVLERPTPSVPRSSQLPAPPPHGADEGAPRRSSKKSPPVPVPPGPAPSPEPAPDPSKQNEPQVMPPAMEQPGADLSGSPVEKIVEHYEVMGMTSGAPSGGPPRSNVLGGPPPSVPRSSQLPTRPPQGAGEGAPVRSSKEPPPMGVEGAVAGAVAEEGVPVPVPVPVPIPEGMPPVNKGGGRKSAKRRTKSKKRYCKGRGRGNVRKTKQTKRRKPTKRRKQTKKRKS